MENKPMVSIIVPVYNVEKQLDRCIKSLVGQTYRDIEILLIDDGSKDKTWQLISSLHNEDSLFSGIKLAGGQLNISGVTLPSG